MLLQILFYLVVSFISTAHAIDTTNELVAIDYQLYTNSLGNEYSRVHFPLDKNQTVLKLNANYAVGPLITVGDDWSEFDIRHLPRTDLSIEKYFGSGEVLPFVALQTAAEANIGEMPTQPIIQARNAIVGLSMGPADKFRASVAVMKGVGFHSKEDATSIIASGGVSKQKFGFATSFVMEDISKTTSASKLSAGLYYGKEKSRFVVEYDKQFDKEYKPGELSIGVRKSHEWNSRDVFLFSSFALGTNSSPGSAPRFNLGITFNLQKNKKPPLDNAIKEEKTETVTNSADEEDDLVTVITETLPVDSGDKVIPPKLDEEKKNIEIITNQPKEKDRNTYNGSKTSDVVKKEDHSGEKKMQNPPQSETTNTYELQPSTAITPESLGQLSAANSSDPTLTLLLAILAVVGGGAAWKFYTQYSEQKHDQKMKQMEIDAKMQGLSGAQPPPCQAEKIKVEAELKELKARLGKIDQKMSLNADFDGDLFARKFKKLERRVKDLEEREE